MAKTVSNPVIDAQDVVYTTWHNPMDVDAKIVVYLGPGKATRYTIPAKGSSRIPSEYDRAIRTEYDGQVVGGLGPNLLKMGAENPPMNEALDSAKLEEKKAIEQATTALLSIERSKAALLVAEARAEAAKAALSAKASKSTTDK